MAQRSQSGLMGAASCTLAAIVACGLFGCAADLDREASRERLRDRERLVQEGGERAEGRVAAAAMDGAEADSRPYYVFTSFKTHWDGYGLFLLTSRDGFHWRRVNAEPFLLPVVDNSAEMKELNDGGDWWTYGARGMRDPCVALGPDGWYHLVWTWERGSRSSIGYARSRDLVEWEDVRKIRMTPREWKNDFCWAPAIVHDPEGKWWPMREEEGGGEWLVTWSTAVEGRFTETEPITAHNHRIYARRTADFRTFSPAELFFDPGYPVIDPAFYETEEGVPVLFFKDELRRPEKKQVRMTWWEARDAPPSVALTVEMAEGATAIRIGEFVYVYFDEYTRGRYGAIRSRNLAQWQDVSPLMEFPERHRHGTVIEVAAEIGGRLEAMAEAAGRPTE